MLLFREHKINGPATAIVGAWAAEVMEDGLLATADLFQCVGQEGEAIGVELPRGALIRGGSGQ
jgi:hypothetical protein